MILCVLHLKIEDITETQLHKQDLEQYFEQLPSYYISGVFDKGKA